MTMLDPIVLALQNAVVFIHRAQAGGTFDDFGRLLPRHDERLGPYPAYIRPLSGKDLEILPAGADIKESKKLFVAHEIRGLTQNPAAPADLIEHKSELYEVQTVFDRNDDAGYYKAIVTRTPGQP